MSFRLAYLLLAQVLSWLAPVLIGDTIHPEAEVVVARETGKPLQGVWTLEYRTINQRRETTMTFTSSFLVRRRTASGDA